MRHQYSDATTKRYFEWLAARIIDGNTDPPKLAEIEAWLGDAEDYRDPLNALRNLCVGLREANAPTQLQHIADGLIYELEEERRFASKAESFFSDVIRRCGVESYDVRMFDKRQQCVGTLQEEFLKLQPEPA